MKKERHENRSELLCIDCSSYTSMSLAWAYYDKENFHMPESAAYSVTTPLGLHSEKLPLLCDMLRKQRNGSYANLSIVVVNLGPGSFTGTRSALAFAKGLCCGIKRCVLIGASSCELIARCYEDCRPLLTVSDARSRRIFHSLYIDASWEQQSIYDHSFDELAEHVLTAINRHGKLYLAGPLATDLQRKLCDATGVSEKKLLTPQTSWDAVNTIQILSSIGIERKKKHKHSSIHCVPYYVRKEV